MPTGVQKNAEITPLSQLTLTYKDNDGEEFKIPALDKRWAVRDIFTSYHSLMGSGGIKTGVELDEWHYEAVAFLEDIEFLLNQPQHVFWSYMLFQKSALAAVVSFLQHCHPFYSAVINESNVPPEEFELYERILNVVLRVVCRLITSKESTDGACLEKEHHRQLLYANYLITVPMLLDMIVAVGDATTSNVDVLRRVFRVIFKIEPQYKKDLTSALAFYRAAFQSIQRQAENEGFEGAGGGASEENEETPYDDVALYTLDCAYTLSVLLEVCAEARTICAEIKLAQSIAHFYDNTIPFLYKNICMISETASSLGWLNQARLQLLKAFRSIAYSYVEAVLNKPEESLVPSEHYIALLTECLSEQTFVIDYERQYSVEADVDILRQACRDLDDFKASFVVSGYKKEAEEESRGTIGNMALILEEVDRKRQQEQNVKEVPSPSAAAKKPTSSAPKPARDIDLEITEVIDVLPHLGTGFARRLVERYESKEEAIAAVLEENLPPDLQSLDHAEVYIPPDPQDKLYHETGVKHFNVYDGDEYDVMSQDKPNCIIKQGKGMPNEARNAAELLDDKRDMQLVRHRYENYTLVAENDNDDDEYNDEYDDSYEAVLESETKVKSKSKEMRAALANVKDVSDDDDDDDDDDDEPNKGDGEEKNATGKRMDFCENPEVIRARYEARRQAKWGNRGVGSGGGNSGGGNSGGGGGGGQKHDVVGAAKGQGQEKDVLRNRNKKEVNKSSRANHNRKAGAAFKRNKGMMS